MGGVASARDARDLLDAGATLVAVGTETFRDPAIAARESPRELREIPANSGETRRLSAVSHRLMC